MCDYYLQLLKDVQLWSSGSSALRTFGRILFDQTQKVGMVGHGDIATFYSEHSCGNSVGAMDIEDSGASTNVEDVRITNGGKDSALVFPKSYKTKAHDRDVDQFTKSVPGTQKVWLKTYGCSHNISDSEYMEGILKNYGFRMTERQDEADIWLLNSCTVKDPSQAAFMHLVHKAKEKNLPVVVAGCVSQADRKLPGLEDVSVVGITQIDRIVEAMEQTLQGNTVKMLQKKALPSLDLPKVRRNPLVEIIPLSTGCLGACTYCKTRQARGKLGSYALESIVHRACTAIDDGVAEIWLTSEDTGAYGRDIGTDIGKLLIALTEVLPGTTLLQPDGQANSISATSNSSTSIGGTMLRVGMTNPPYMLEHLEVIADILRHPMVYSFLHIPVQAASNRVLEAMNREYTIEEFRTVVDYLMANVPGMTVATDIICGFPNETEEDFEETMELMRRYQFAITNISQFYPRPGTPAAKMRRIPTDIVKDRSRRLTKLFESFDPYAYLVGQERVLVWFDIEEATLHAPNVKRGEGKRQSVGHTKSYVKVLVDYDESLPGSCCYVSINKNQRFHVEGIVMERVYSRRVPVVDQQQVGNTVQSRATKDDDNTTRNNDSVENNGRDVSVKTSSRRNGGGNNNGEMGSADANPPPRSPTGFPVLVTLSILALTVTAGMLYYRSRKI